MRRTDNTGFDVLTNIATGVNSGARAVVARISTATGDDDVAVANATSGNVVLLRNNGVEGFGQESPAGTPAGAAPSDIVAADFDGNGRPDVAVANASSNTVSVLLRNAGNDGFTNAPGSPIAVGPGPSGLATADFDRNGQPDLDRRLHERVRHVLRGSGGGVAADAPIALTGDPTGATTADFNLDGVADAAISSRGTNQLHVLLSPSPPAQPPPAPTPTPTPPPRRSTPPGGRGQLLPVKGTVKVKLKGSKTYVELKAGLQVKAGASVDTRHGTVTIVGPRQRRQGGLLRRPVPDQPVQGADDADADRGARLPQAGRDGGGQEAEDAAGCGATARAASGPRAATARPPCAAPNGSSRTPAPRPRRG